MPRCGVAAQEEKESLLGELDSSKEDLEATTRELAASKQELDKLRRDSSGIDARVEALTHSMHQLQGEMIDKGRAMETATRDLAAARASIAEKDAEVRCPLIRAGVK